MDNKNKNPNVPNLRFKDFGNYKWNIDKIYNIAPLQRGFDLPEQNIIHGSVPVVYSNGIKNYHNQYKAKAPGIITGRSGTVGKFTYIEDGYYWPHNTSLWVTDFKCNYPKFIYFLFQYVKFENYSTGSGVPTLNRNDIHDKKVGVPKIEEQIKIATFLTKIDERIELQNKIIEDLIALRKSIIERTFSLVNSSWNKFTFNDIFIERKEMHIKDSSVIHATLSKEGIFPKTDRYDRDFLVKDEDKKYKVSYLNDICYNPANLKFGVITRNNYGKCIISPIYVTYEVKPSFNPKFIELFVTRSAFLKEIRKYEQGTVYERMAVSSDDFLTYTTRLPDVDFQNEIVSKIDLFDKKITQEKIYLELLKNQKNYLLSNLFI